MPTDPGKRMNALLPATLVSTACPAVANSSPTWTSEFSEIPFSKRFPKQTRKLAHQNKLVCNVQCKYKGPGINVGYFFVLFLELFLFFGTTRRNSRNNTPSKKEGTKCSKSKERKMIHEEAMKSKEQ